MGIIRTVDPASEPVTTDEAKKHIRFCDDFTDDDAYIDSLIKAAREQAEAYTNRAFVTQTWQYTLNRFPCRPIELPINPVNSVSSIQYVDQDGATQTWDPSKYTVNLTEQIAKIVPAYGESYPSVRCEPNALTVTFIAGQDVEMVPESYKLAIKMIVGHWYENRGYLGMLPESAERLLFPFRLVVSY